MTLVVGVVTPHGVVLGADGLVSSFNNPIQTPADKLFSLGDAFAVGVSGHRHLYEVMVASLRASPLAGAAAGAVTMDDAIQHARTAVRDGVVAYTAQTAFNPNRPLTEQIGEASVVLAGICSDGQLLRTLDQTANVMPPLTANYTTLGSGARDALLLMEAYSRYNYAAHPLATSVLLVKRVMDMVAAAVPDIGGVISVLKIATVAGADGTHLSPVDLNAAEILAAMAHWEILESEMYDALAGHVAAPAGGPGAQAAGAAAVHAGGVQGGHAEGQGAAVAGGAEVGHDAAIAEPVDGQPGGQQEEG